MKGAKGRQRDRERDGEKEQLKDVSELAHKLHSEVNIDSSRAMHGQLHCELTCFALQ